MKKVLFSIAVSAFAFASIASASTSVASVVPTEQQMKDGRTAGILLRMTLRQARLNKLNIQRKY